MKCIMLIADGLGDRPLARLDGKTPLEYADTPTLDRLCGSGMAGLVHPYRPGARCGTDWGHMCLFGYDPVPYYTGRGSVEAYASGLMLEPGDVAFRGNFAWVDDSLTVRDRRAGRISDKAQIRELLNAISGLEIDGCRLLVRSLTEHRLALVLRGEGLCGTVPDTDPGTAREGEPVRRPGLCKDADVQRTAHILWSFLIQVHEIWKDHPVNKARTGEGLVPANFILTRGSGQAMVLPPFTDVYPGARVAVIAGDSTITGIGRMCGFDGYLRESFTGGFHTDYRGKAELAASLLPDYDLVIVHVKGTDLCGHDGLPIEKAQIIEQIDSMFRYWLEQVGDGCYYAMTADHSTPCSMGEHSADPVPAFLAGPDVRIDAVDQYGERACAGGLLNQFTGAQMMAVIMDYLGFNQKYGA